MLGALGGDDHGLPEVGKSATPGEIDDAKAFAGEKLGERRPRKEFNTTAVPQSREMVVQVVGERHRQILQIAVIRRGEDEYPPWFEPLIKRLDETSGVIKMLDDLEADNGIEWLVEDADDVFVDASELEGDAGIESAGDLDTGFGKIHPRDLVLASSSKLSAESAVAATGVKDATRRNESFDLLEDGPPNILVNVGRQWGLKFRFEVLVGSLGNQSAKPFLVGENLFGLGCWLDTGSSEMDLIGRFAVLHVLVPPTIIIAVVR
jgi:hypothetical protein